MYLDNVWGNVHGIVDAASKVDLGAVCFLAKVALVLGLLLQLENNRPGFKDIELIAEKDAVEAPR